MKNEDNKQKLLDLLIQIREDYKDQLEALPFDLSAEREVYSAVVNNRIRRISLIMGLVKAFDI